MLVCLCQLLSYRIIESVKTDFIGSSSSYKCCFVVVAYFTARHQRLVDLCRYLYKLSLIVNLLYFIRGESRYLVNQLWLFAKTFIFIGLSINCVISCNDHGSRDGP